MIKFFIFSTLVLGGILIFFVYRFKGTVEYKENFPSMRVIFVAYLCIGMLMIVFQPEIKNLMYQVESPKNISTEFTQVSNSAEVERIIRASFERSCTCPVDIETVDKVIEIGEFAYNGGSLKVSEMFYGALVNDDKILFIRNDTKVACYFSESYRVFVPVVFFEGEYKGRRAYVMENRLQEQ